MNVTLEVTQCGGVDVQLPLEIQGRAGTEKEGKQGRAQREGADKAGCREGPGTVEREGRTRKTLLQNQAPRTGLDSAEASGRREGGWVGEGERGQGRTLLQNRAPFLGLNSAEASRHREGLRQCDIRM